MALKPVQRINVVGCCGSGKSTLAVRIGEKLQAPVVELDQLFWKPNWEESTDEEVIAKLEQSLSNEKWVLAGNYNRFQPVKWKNVDMVVWVDPPFLRNLWQVFIRSLRRAFSSKEIWPGTGCTESFWRTFFTKDSVILWMITTHRGVVERYESYMTRADFKHIQWVRLKSRAEFENFLERI